MLTTPWRLLALCLTAILLTGACSGGESSSPSDPEGGETVVGEDEEVSRSDPGTLTVDVSGDLEFAFEEDLDLRIVVIRHPRVTAVRFLSVGIETFQTLPDGSAFRIAFDLGGVYDGKGEYELPVAGRSEGPPISVDPNDPQAGAVQGISKPFLLFSAEGNPTEDPTLAASVRSFENTLEPCTLKVLEDDAGSGELDCPEVTDTEGQGRVSVRMKWATA